MTAPPPEYASNRDAYSAIRRAIVDGTFRSGERLVEQDIAARFGVSRTPVREALLILTSEGLVTTEMNRGCRVRRLDRAAVDDIYGLRSTLEAYAAELAATRADNASIEALREAKDAFDEAVHRPKPDIDEITQWNNEFHSLILRAAGHVLLDAVVPLTVDHPLVYRAFQQFNFAELKRSSTFHGLIFDAIAGRRPRAAAEFMREHVDLGRTGVLSSDEWTSDDVPVAKSRRARPSTRTQLMTPNPHSSDADGESE